MVVAIDGPAGVGKSTVSRCIAERAGFYYLNSGNFYRAVTYLVLKEKVSLNDKNKVLEIAGKIVFSVKNGTLLVNGENLEEFLHTDEVDAHVAQLSSIVEVRRIVNKALHKISEGLDIVVEGRDITTVVFPDADLKIFLDASVETRAKRRWSQGVSSLSFEEIRKGIEKRDSIDRNKKEGSLKISSDALYLDTSDLTIEQVCEKVVETLRIVKKASRRNKNVMMDRESDIAETQTDLQEEYLKSLKDLEEGQLIESTVIEISTENVFVDVGYKSEGKIPLTEFQTPPQIGDTVNVILVRKEGKGGQVIVSKGKADVKVFWKELRKASQEQEPVEGTFSKSIKGGFEVDLGYGVTGFCPLSKTDVIRVEEPEEYVGKKAKFLIDRLYSENKLKIVLSRRGFLERDIKEKKEKFFSTTEVGDTVTGEVKSFTSFGAFIDLGGFDGLLHINDMSWGHVTRPKDFVKKGEKVELKVIRLDPEEQKINLSLKHFTPDPWTLFEQKYHVDDVVKGKVTKLTDFGAFIEIEEGIEGLAHISELSWVKRIQHPSELLSIGDEVEAKILAYDIENGRVSLGVKQVYDNPWDTIDESFPVGKRLTGKIVKVTNAGAFIELAEGIDGFLHIDDYSWTKRIKKPSSVLKTGEDIEVMVIDLDKESRRIKLGVKQLSEDPWKSLIKSTPKGSVVEGEITNITDFGVFVKVSDGIEGLINKYNLAEPGSDRDEDVLSKYSVGDKVKALISEINPGAHRLSLSVRDYLNSLQRKEISKYIHDEEDESKSTFGDFLKNKDLDSIEE